MTTRKLISIVTPCYNEEDNVETTYTTARRIMEEQLGEYEYEHIFSDNASTDRTVELLARIAEEDKRVKVVVNSRNIGPFRNNFNALKHTRGDAVLVMLAADLQDPPELIPELVRHWEDGYKVVFGLRAKREEAWWLCRLRKLYYRLVEYMSEIRIPADAGEFQLVDRVVVDSLNQVDDYYPYIRGLIAQTGFRAIGVSYTWRRRERGVSKNRIVDMIDHALNGIISTSKAPMRLCILLGLFLSVASFVYAMIQLVISLVTLGKAPGGMPTVIVGLFFFNGVLLFFIGILGEYVLAIHEQLRRGPPVVEVKKINLD